MRSWLGAVAAALLLAGCGSAAAGPAGPAVRATAPSSSRAAALARHLVAEMTVPPFNTPRSPSMWAMGQSDRLHRVRLRTLPPSR